METIISNAQHIFTPHFARLRPNLRKVETSYKQPNSPVSCALIYLGRSRMINVHGIHKSPLMWWGLTHIGVYHNSLSFHPYHLGPTRTPKSTTKQQMHGAYQTVQAATIGTAGDF